MDCKINTCKGFCGKNKNSPEGLGVCGHCLNPNTVCVGANGKMWILNDKKEWNLTPCQEKIDNLTKKINQDFKKLKLKKTKIYKRSAKKLNPLGLEDLLYDKKHYTKDGKISKSGLKHILDYNSPIVINAETELDSNEIFSHVQQILNKYQLNKCLRFDGSDSGYKKVGSSGAFKKIGYSYFYKLL